MTGTTTVLDLLREPDRSARGATVAELTDVTGLHPNTVRQQLARLGDEGTVLSERLPPAGRGRPRLVYRAAPLPPVKQSGTALGDPLGTGPESPFAHSASPEERAVRESLTRVLLNGYGQHAESPAQQAEDAGFALAQENHPTPREGAPRSKAVGPAADATTTGTTAADRHDRPAHALAAQHATLTEHLSSLGFAPAAGSRADLHVDLLRCPFLDLASQRPDIVCAMHLGLVRGVLAQVPGPLRARGLRPFVGPSRCVLDLDLAPGSGASAASVPADAHHGITDLSTTIADPSGPASSS